LPVPNAEDAFHPHDDRLLEDEQHDELRAIMDELVAETAPRFATAA
jgi:hypothetical protein